MPFGDFLTYWLAAIAPTRLKPATLNSYEGHSRLYIKPALGKRGSTASPPSTFACSSRSSRAAASAACEESTRHAPRKTGRAAP
ncbi:tyrosine-type recombinase/integrase [Streptomyces decoyicus]|uniref:hypothetical protein n=1 Tax=Streptomyces decoyicus TaxID=249567 RepID=UPI003825F4BF